MHDIRFTAIAGINESGELSWLETNRVTWWITDRGAGQVVVVGTPCVGFEAAVTVTEEQIVLDRSKMQVAAIFCEPPRSDYDRWVHRFTELPLNYSWDEETLTISNKRGSLTMTPDSSST
ncbi:hypothetical protein [Arthrobacter ruber]|uniref:hypothetical protein n=1 Tax=Arthrobacter ruber TaxID=1258893 RepID=UPI000CF36386|nr:hypothetical protein [Arthrobacter ruber]